MGFEGEYLPSLWKGVQNFMARPNVITSTLKSVTEYAKEPQKHEILEDGQALDMVQK